MTADAMLDRILATPEPPEGYTPNRDNQLHDRAERQIADAETGHTAFQIAHFIIGQAGPTTWGMLKQARREIRGRMPTLGRRSVPLWRRVVRRMGLGRVMRPPTAGDAQGCREIRLFVEHAERLERQLVEENPDGIDAARLDAEFWRVRIIRMALIEVLGTGRLSVSSFETISALPPPMRDGILGKLSAARRLADQPDPDRAALRMIDEAGEPIAPPDEGTTIVNLDRHPPG